jgi:hypothetical protein
MGRRRAGQLHGEEASHERPWGPAGQRGADPADLHPLRGRQEGVLRPRAGEEFFSQDDAQRVVGMMHIGSEALDWR